jgi:hypothetical protein
MAKPKLALIPAAQGSKLFSVLPSSGVGDFDFTRDTIATRINSQGLIEEVSNGQSRLNYPMIDGKVVGCPHHILEPQSTNSLTYSEDFSQSYWYKSGSYTITSNYGISPDGTNNSTRIQGSANVVIYRDVSSATDSRSIYVKATSGSGNIQLLSHNSNTNNVFAIDENWKRVEINSASVRPDNFYLVDFRGASTDVFDIEIWGAQTEVGSYATSYIPTNGSATTRAAETANGSGDAATFNDSEGVLMAEISALANDLTYRILSLSNGTLAERVYLQYTNASNTISTVVKKGSSTQANISYVLPNETEFNKVLLKYKSNDFALWVNGFEVGTDTSGNTPIGLSELAFDDGNGNNVFQGKTKQLQYYNSALTDSELSQLTSWTSFTDMAEGQQYNIE